MANLYLSTKWATCNPEFMILFLAGKPWGLNLGEWTHSTGRCLAFIPLRAELHESLREKCDVAWDGCRPIAVALDD